MFDAYIRSWKVIDSKLFVGGFCGFSHGLSLNQKRHVPPQPEDFMGRCREGALVLGGGEVVKVVKVSSDKDHWGCSTVILMWHS